MRRVCLIVAALLAGCTRPGDPPPARQSTAPIPPVSPYGAEFQAQWPENRAHVFTYALTLRRDGATRGGKATAVFLPGKMSPATNSLVGTDAAQVTNTIPVLTLHLTREYRSGTREMESVWMTTISIDGLPEGGIRKVTSSQQTWTGHWWQQWLISKGSILVDRYGDVPGGRKVIDFPPVFVPEQALPLCARRIAWPRMRLGQKRPTYVMRDSIPQEPVQITLSLSSDRYTATTPAGDFRTHLFTARWPDGAERKWYVGIDPPHPIVRWEFSDGEQAALLESKTVNADEL